jgi:hypothetical protein
MGRNRRVVVGRQRVGGLARQRRQLLAESADPIGPVLGGAVWVGHHAES